MADALADVKQRAADCKKKLEDERKKIERYTNDIVGKVQDSFAADKTRKLDVEATLRQLDEQIRIFQEEQARINKIYEAEAFEEKSLEVQIGQLKSQESSWPAKIGKQIASLEKLKEELQLHKNALEEKERARKTALAEVTHGVTLYKTRLGLEFERIGPNRLRFIFTQVNKNKLEEKYTFSMFVTQDDKYHLEECAPVVDSALMAPMLEELNGGNDFGKFVREMRKRFKDIAAVNNSRKA